MYNFTGGIKFQMGSTRRTHHVRSEVAHADRPAEGRTLARPAPPIKADREAGGSKVAAEGPRLRPSRPEMEEAGRRAGSDREEAAGSPVVADGREGPSRLLRSGRLEATGVREGQGGSCRRDEGEAAGDHRHADRGDPGRRELDPMPEQAKTARPAPKKKAA